MIEVVEHDPAWADRFGQLRRRYESALVGVPVAAIEHVGSTAVPCLAAKPVIDVDVVVDRMSVPKAVAAMQRIGFVPVEDLGIADRWALRAPPELPRTNTYVVVDGCLAHRNHLAVRKVLRSDPVLRDEYAAVKRALAASVADIDEYVAGKTAMLVRVLRRAGLGDEEIAAIEATNRATGR